MKRAVGGVAVAGLLWAAPGGAMGIRADDTELARSDDGKLQLVEHREHGPEGGGALSYRLLAEGRPPEEFRVSSDFSPGDGSRPQSVSREACEANLARLAKRVEGWKARVRVRPAACREPGREGGVAVGKD